MQLNFRKAIAPAILLMSMMMCSFAVAQGDSPQPVLMTPDDIQWSGDGNKLQLQTAPLVGNPSAPEPYAERIKLPANFRLPPHSHPNEARMVVVLSGTLYYAFGDTFDETKLKAFPPGSFFTEPKDMPHYALTKEEVVLQLNAIGPAATKIVEGESKGK